MEQTPEAERRRKPTPQSYFTFKRKRKDTTRAKMIRDLPDGEIAIWILMENPEPFVFDTFKTFTLDRQVSVLNCMRHWGDREDALERVFGDHWKASDVAQRLSEQDKADLRVASGDVRSLYPMERMIAWDERVFGDDAMIDYLNEHPETIGEHWTLIRQGGRETAIILNRMKIPLIWDFMYKLTGDAHWFRDCTSVSPTRATEFEEHTATIGHDSNDPTCSTSQGPLPMQDSRPHSPALPTPFHDLEQEQPSPGKETRSTNSMEVDDDVNEVNRMLLEGFDDAEKGSETPGHAFRDQGSEEERLKKAVLESLDRYVAQATETRNSAVASPLAAAKVIKQVLDVLASRASLHALVCVGEPMEMDSLAIYEYSNMSDDRFFAPGPDPSKLLDRFKKHVSETRPPDHRRYNDVRELGLNVPPEVHMSQATIANRAPTVPLGSGSPYSPNVDAALEEKRAGLASFFTEIYKRILKEEEMDFLKMKEYMDSTWVGSERYPVHPKTAERVQFRDPAVMSQSEISTWWDYARNSLDPNPATDVTLCHWSGRVLEAIRGHDAWKAVHHTPSRAATLGSGVEREADALLGHRDFSVAGSTGSQDRHAIQGIQSPRQDQEPRGRSRTSSSRWTPPSYLEDDADAWAEPTKRVVPELLLHSSHAPRFQTLSNVGARGEAHRPPQTVTLTPDLGVTRVPPEAIATIHGFINNMGACPDIYCSSPGQERHYPSVLQACVFMTASERFPASQTLNVWTASDAISETETAVVDMSTPLGTTLERLRNPRAPMLSASSLIASSAWSEYDFLMLIRIIYLDLVRWWDTSTERRPHHLSFWAAYRELRFLEQGAFIMDRLRSPATIKTLNLGTWINEKVVRPLARHVVGLAMTSFLDTVVLSAQEAYWSKKPEEARTVFQVCQGIVDRCIQRALTSLRTRNLDVLDSVWLAEQRPGTLGDLKLLSEEWFRLIDSDFQRIPLNQVIRDHQDFDLHLGHGVPSDMWQQATVADALGMALCVLGRAMRWEQETHRGNSPSFSPHAILQSLGVVALPPPHNSVVQRALWGEVADTSYLVQISSAKEGLSPETVFGPVTADRAHFDPTAGTNAREQYEAEVPTEVDARELGDESASDSGIRRSPSPLSTDTIRMALMQLEDQGYLRGNPMLDPHMSSLGPRPTTAEASPVLPIRPSRSGSQGRGTTLESHFEASYLRDPPQSRAYRSISNHTTSPESTGPRLDTRQLSLERSGPITKTALNTDRESQRSQVYEPSDDVDALAGKFGAASLTATPAPHQAPIPASTLSAPFNVSGEGTSSDPAPKRPHPLSSPPQAESVASMKKRPRVQSPTRAPSPPSLMHRLMKEDAHPSSPGGTGTSVRAAPDASQAAIQATTQAVPSTSQSEIGSSALPVNPPTQANPAPEDVRSRLRARRLRYSDMVGVRQSKSDGYP